jgi:hypothetical protein
LEIVEVASRSRDRLLDTVDYISRDIQPILYVNVSSSEGIDAAAEPEENCDARAPDT